VSVKWIKGAVVSTVLIGCIWGTPFHASAEGISRLEILEKKGEILSGNKDAIYLGNVKNRQVVVKMKEGTVFNARKWGLNNLPRTGPLKDRNIFIVHIPNTFPYEETLKKISNENDVEEVQPDLLAEPQGKLQSYNPLEKRQWYLQAIRAVEAQNLTPPINETIVAVIDSGVDYRHPDLASQVVVGFNAYKNNDDPMDNLGHGTRVAGIIGAGINNGIGISGINPNVKIMPLKAGDEQGLSLSDTIEAIYYAIDHGAHVINMSYGSDQADILEYEAVVEAFNSGIVLVSATGNAGSKVNFPAAYPQVIAVGAVDQELKVTGFSNKGNEVDLVAPGTSIISTSLRGTYDWGDGTSFSAPMVSAAASYLKGINSKLTPAQIEYLLEKSASKVRVRGYNTFLNPYGGYGILNLFSGIQTSLPETNNDTGDTIDNAREMMVGQSFADRYDVPMDEDWFKLTITKKMRLQVDISGVRSMDALSWFARIENGEVVQENVVDTTGVNGKELFRFNVKPGTYYFQVLEMNNHWSPEPYKISFSEADVVPPVKPIVKSVLKTDNVVRGSAERGAKVFVKKGTKIIGTAISTSRATFQVVIPFQSKNTMLTLYAVDPAGNISPGVQVKVR
jgi:cell wall-associated protease